MSSSYIAPTRRKPTPTNISVILPSAGPGRRMRSYGAKGLIQLNDTNVINRQITLIKEKWPESEIIVITGFQSDKVLKSIENRNVKSVENHIFEETSVLYSIGLALRVVTYTNVLILYGDLVFEKTILDLPLTSTSVITGNMPNDSVGTNIDGEYICHFEYGIPNKWCQIAFIDDSGFTSLKKHATNKDNFKLHTFEIFNKMIDEGHKFKNLPAIGEIVEIENTVDIDRARKVK